MGEGDRFSSAKDCFCRHETNKAQEKQFAAMTFFIVRRHGLHCLSGTDNTLVGGKEDFNMSFTCPVPAQADALVYLLDAAKRYSLPIRVKGHSKGGNLSVYAAAYAQMMCRTAFCASTATTDQGWMKERFQAAAICASCPSFAPSCLTLPSSACFCNSHTQARSTVGGRAC